MADAMTVTTSLTTDQAAYNRLAYFALRPEMHFDNVADVMPTEQAMPGSSVIFQKFTDMSVATTALNESVDVDAVAVADSQVTVTLAEYGNAVITSAKIRGTSFIEIDPIVANLVGFNAGISLDTICRQRLQVGTVVLYSGTGSARNTVKPTDTLTAANCRRALATLKDANAMPIAGGMFVTFIHPDVEYDLRGETGAAAWRDPHTYSAPENIWSGETGAFEGSRFVVTPRAPLFADAGSSTTLTDVYGTIFTSQQALAKAFSTTDGNGAYPQVRFGAVTDKLRRFVPIGWYFLGDYAIFRQESLVRYESASTIGTNA